MSDRSRQPQIRRSPRIVPPRVNGLYHLALMRVSLTKTIGFEAAHFLPSFPEGHKCRRMHGHSFRIDVVVEGEIPEGQFHLIDYGDLKSLTEPLRRQLDHYCLNEIEGLENPTSEVLAKWVWDRLKPQLTLLAAIIVHETCTTRCEYRGE